jgi:hypothetical protein
VVQPTGVAEGLPNRVLARDALAPASTMNCPGARVTSRRGALHVRAPLPPSEIAVSEPV